MATVGALLNTYRFYPEVQKAIDTILGQSRPPDVFVITDNGSDDGSVEHLRRDYPDATVLAIRTNRGSPAGLNVGLQAVLRRDVDYVLVCTHDCILAPDALERLVARLDEEPSVGLVAPLLGFSSAPDLVFSAGGVLLQRTWDDRHVRVPKHVADWKGVGPSIVDWVDGACILVRAEALRAAGALYSDYFYFYDDVEFSMRVRDAGWFVECVPAALAWQEPGAPSPFIRARNRLRFIKRTSSRTMLVREITRQVKYLGVLAAQSRSRDDLIDVQLRALGLLAFLRGQVGPQPERAEVLWQRLKERPSAREAEPSSERDHKQAESASPHDEDT